MTIDEELGAIEGAAKRLLHIGQQPAPPQRQPTFTPHPQTAQPVSSQQSQPEVRMSALLTDAEKAAKALVAHVGTLLANPLVDAVIEAGLGTVLTPGEVAAVVAFVKAIEAERTPQPQPSGGTVTAAAGAQQAAQAQARTAQVV